MITFVAFSCILKGVINNTMVLTLPTQKVSKPSCHYDGSMSK